MKTLDEDFPPMLTPQLLHVSGDYHSINAGLAKLRDPFPAHQISKLPKPTKSQNECPNDQKINCTVCGGWHHPRVIHLDYVGHAALTDRLLDCDPNWSWEPLALGQNGLPVLDSNGGMWIRLVVCGVSRIGYGDAQGKTGGNAIKECIGDALRNAAMRFGAALDLWHKGDLHIEAEPKQESGDDETAEWAEGQAMLVRSLFAKGDIEGAATILNMLGTNGTYDGEAKELVWGRLESNVRSAIKAYDAISQAKTLEGLKKAWDAAPIHSKTALEKAKDKRKAELATGLLVQPEQAAA